MLCLIVVCSNKYSNALSSDVFRVKLSLLAHTGAHSFTSHSKCNSVSSMMTGLMFRRLSLRPSTKSQFCASYGGLLREQLPV